MMLYLTGATASQTSSEVTQDDPMKSLGGYISNSPVPNGAINALFDLVSMKTIKDKAKECVAIGLVNKFDVPVADISAKIISDRNNVCGFKIAAVATDDKLCMEHINNRYSEPMNAEFYDVTFYRASVYVEIVSPGIVDEEIVFDPFDVTAVVKEAGIEGTYKAIEEAFSKTVEYRVIRLSENKFRIESNDDEAVETPLKCSFISTENANFKFLGDFKNEQNNEVYLAELLQPNQGIGIWIQREILDVAERDNDELIKDFDENKKLDTVEGIELAINYNMFEGMDLDGGSADEPNDHLYHSKLHIDGGDSEGVDSDEEDD